MCSAGVVAAGVALSHKRMSRTAEWRSGGQPNTQTVTPPPSTDGVARRKREGEGGDPVEELGAAAGQWVAGWGWGARTRPTTETATTWPPAELSIRLVATKREEEGHRQQGETGSGDRCTSQTCDSGRCLWPVEHPCTSELGDRDALATNPTGVGEGCYAYRSGRKLVQPSTADVTRHVTKLEFNQHGLSVGRGSGGFGRQCGGRGGRCSDAF